MDNENLLRFHEKDDVFNTYGLHTHTFSCIEMLIYIVSPLAAYCRASYTTVEITSLLTVDVGLIE